MGVLLIVDVIKTACCGRVGDFKSGSTRNDSQLRQIRVATSRNIKVCSAFDFLNSSCTQKNFV